MTYYDKEQKSRWAKGMILSALIDVQPLTAAELEHRLTVGRNYRLTKNQISTHLGYLRSGHAVEKIDIVTGFHRFRAFGQLVTRPQITRFWFITKSMSRDQLIQFRRSRENLLEQKYPLMKRRRRAPITDDMRQMIEDMRC